MGYPWQAEEMIPPKNSIGTEEYIGVTTEHEWRPLWKNTVVLNTVETQDNIVKYYQSSHQIWMEIYLWSLPLGSLHWNI